MNKINYIYRYIFPLLIVVALILSIDLYFMIKQKGVTDKNILTNVTTGQMDQRTKPIGSDQRHSILTQPIADALTRITKKPFGLKVSPQDSPVSPERFVGYHTGVDFETLLTEQDSEIQIYSICSGPLLLKKWASGYGGVAVQECNIDNKNVTVVYGHLKLASIVTEVGHKLVSGDKIGILGRGYSTETDGERKHLHLGIHLGTTIDIKGYATTQDQLSRWLDPLQYL